MSLKQGGPDPTAEGSSSTVDSWCATPDSAEATCNGRWQVATVTLDRHPTDFSGRPLASLQNGRSRLQFCVVPDDAGEANPEGIASKNRWVRVIGAR